MPNLRRILQSSVQRMGAFLFSWDALIFCFFCLLATGFWFFRTYDHESTKTETAGANETIVYTEKTIEVSIRPKNVPSGEHLVVFPDHVTVVARVTLAAYNELSANDFQASCSYPKGNADHLKVEVVHTNSEVASFRFSPQEVEYIIEKNLQ